MKVPLCAVGDMRVDEIKTVDFFGREVLVFQVDGEPKAALNYCMHLGGPLKRYDDKLDCEWHGAEFECRTGKRLKGPARPETTLIVLPTRVEDGTLNYEYGDE
jgi:nitrite reductase/ring-hydroxylating ferredoxin subunit